MFGILHKKYYREVLNKIDATNNDNLIKFFRQIPFMNYFSQKFMRELHLFLELQTYNANQIVFYEGMPADFVLFVKEGTFEITRTYSDKDCHV